MKKKLTLLIALSIIIGYFLMPITVVAAGPIEASSPDEMVVELEEEPRMPLAAEEETIIEEVTIELLSIEEIAKQVIAGNWGSGEDRKNKLNQAGYNYEEVQQKVDQLMPKKEIYNLPSGDYPEAQLIWNTMISWGWTPETCAGIIGNMMAEIGGGTLNLSNWKSDDGCGYGLIQWTSGRASTIKNRYGSYPTIEQQLIFVKDELFGTNNTRQQVNPTILKQIMNVSGAETPESVALTFATHYERCGQSYRAKRQNYARIAYNYFINK